MGTIYEQMAAAFSRSGSPSAREALAASEAELDTPQWTH